MLQETPTAKTARAKSLPPESTSRANLIEVLRRDYGVTLHL